MELRLLVCGSDETWESAHCRIHIPQHRPLKTYTIRTIHFPVLIDDVRHVAALYLILLVSKTLVGPRIFDAACSLSVRESQN